MILPHINIFHWYTSINFDLMNIISLQLNKNNRAENLPIIFSTTSQFTKLFHEKHHFTRTILPQYIKINSIISSSSSYQQTPTPRTPFNTNPSWKPRHSFTDPPFPPDFRNTPPSPSCNHKTYTYTYTSAVKP